MEPASEREKKKKKNKRGRIIEVRKNKRKCPRTTRQDNVLVKLGSDIEVGGLDAVEQLLGHTDRLNVDEVGLEEGLGSLESLRADLDHTAVRKRVVLNQDSGFLCLIRGKKKKNKTGLILKKI